MTARAISCAAPMAGLPAGAHPPETPLAYIGGYLVSPRLFEGAPAGQVLDEPAVGPRHRRRAGSSASSISGRWLHVGTPEAIALAEAALKA